MRNTGYIHAIKRPQHNMIDMIVNKMRNTNPVWKGRHSDDYLLGFEMALRMLANANGSFVERLRSLY
jgi:hypothetical protein